MAVCALCKEQGELKVSHIIPKFVTNRIKDNSPFGYMRNMENMLVRIQDGDKIPLLCGECEERFSKREREFSKKIFNPFQDNSNNNLNGLPYGKWLNYFVTSVNWRNLYLDLTGFVQTNELDIDSLNLLINSEEVMRRYLLGERGSTADIENHIFFFDKLENASSEIKINQPNTFFRSSSYGYTFISYSYQGYYVYSNLAGIIICTILKKAKEDIWENTLINNESGIIKIPQRVQSPLMSEVFGLYLENAKKKLPEKQSAKIEKLIKGNPEKLFNSKFFEYIMQDKELDN